IRAMPENEKPPARRVDVYYNGDEPKSGLVQDFVTAYNPGMCFLSLSGIHHISRPKCERYIEQRQRNESL
uniref:hypothetical protein n=1 Tax=[Ruminococcus] torques TaxID=33039 RepID=UPI0027B88809